MPSPLLDTIWSSFCLALSYFYFMFIQRITFNNQPRFLSASQVGLSNLGTSALVAAFSYKLCRSTWQKPSFLLRFQVSFLKISFLDRILVVCVGMSGVALMSMVKNQNHFKFEIYLKKALYQVLLRVLFCVDQFECASCELGLESGDVLLRAAFTLVVMVSIGQDFACVFGV